MVDFAGFEIDMNEVRPSRKYIDTIRNFPQPKTLTDMRAFFGLVNQVAFAFYMSNEMLPFRDLLKPKKQSRRETILRPAITACFRSCKGGNRKGSQKRNKDI